MTTPELTAAREAIAAEVAALNEAPRTYFLGERVTLEIQSDRVDVVGQQPNDNSMSWAAFHGRVRGVGLPSGITPAAAAEFVTDNAELIARVMVGLSEEWSGSSMVGILTEDAEDALDELRQIGEGTIESAPDMWARGEIVEVMTADEYLADVREDIRRQPSAEAAEAWAVEGMNEDGEQIWNEGYVYVSLDSVRATARAWWEAAQPDEDEE